METRRVRLGAVIDDYCPRCRLMMNHGVVGMVGDEVRKVRCNTCITEHVYKHGQLPKRRRTETDRLFKEVLKGMGRDADEDDKRPVEPSPERESETPDRRAAESQETPDEDRPAATSAPGPVRRSARRCAAARRPSKALHDQPAHRREAARLRRRHAARLEGCPGDGLVQRIWPAMWSIRSILVTRPQIFPPSCTSATFPSPKIAANRDTGVSGGTTTKF